MGSLKYFNTDTQQWEFLAAAKGVEDHLSDLDPHEQYLFVNGSRALSGDLSFGNNRATLLGAPSASTDAARKAEVDAHAGATSAHSATAAATASRLVLRDSNGRASFVSPTSAAHAATKGYVDDLLASPGAHLRKTSHQTNIPHNTITQVTWQTTDYNANGAADLSNNRIVATRAGIYVATATVNASNDGNVVRFDIALRVNGSFRATQAVSIGDISGSSVATRASVSLIHRMNQGNYFDLTFRHWSDGGGTQQVNDSTYTSLSAQWLRPW